jgi:hypothetical protein
MKRRHKVALGGLAGLAALLTVGVEIWDRFETWHKEHIAADNQASFDCEVRLCEAHGGRWWRGGCVRKHR